VARVESAVCMALVKVLKAVPMAVSRALTVLTMQVRSTCGCFVVVVRGVVPAVCAWAARLRLPDRAAAASETVMSFFIDIVLDRK